MQTAARSQMSTCTRYRRELSHEDLERLPYTEAVVYETLRMYPPAVLTPRISSAATKVPAA